MSWAPRKSISKLFAAAVAFLFSFPSSAMTFRDAGNGGNCVGCYWLVGEGDITTETLKDFEKFASDKNGTLTIYLDSRGGNLVAGLKLGQSIRAKGLTTAVGKSVPDGYNWQKITAGQCASACAYAFLGGVSRQAAAGEVGVHQFYDEAMLSNPSGKLFSAIDLSANQLVSALVVDHVTRMGADPRIAVIASETSPASMHFFTADELVELKVAWDAGSFGPWAIEPYGSGVVAYSKSQDKTQTATLFCGHDRTFRLLITAPLLADAVELQSAIDGLQDGLQVFGMSVLKKRR